MYLIIENGLLDDAFVLRTKTDLETFLMEMAVDGHDISVFEIIPVDESMKFTVEADITIKGL